MRLSKRFLKLIADHILVTPRRLEALSRIDPQHIYVENIRVLLGGSSWVAKLICETAVRQGIFAKRVQVLCPDGAVAETLNAGQPIPETVRCWKEIDGEAEAVRERTDRLDKIEYYAFVKGAA